MIVGGGIIGAACARELATSGESVLVLEPDNRIGAAWRASAGLLAPQIDVPASAPSFELGVAGREYYRENAPALLSETGIDVELYDEGILHLAIGEGEATRLRNTAAWQRERGHPVDWLDPARARREYPWVGENDGALFAPQDGSVNPIKVVAAFREAARRRGARFEADAALALIVESGRATGVRGERGQYSASQVVLAAGAWTGRLEGLRRPVSVEPVRGQMVAKAWPRHLRPSIIYGAHYYVLERNGEAWCGATMEHAGFAADLTDEGEREVVVATDRLLPALAALPIKRSWLGLRPVTADGLPILGADPDVPNLWYATGHGRNGILLAGVTAVALARLMAGQETFAAIEAMRPERF